MLQRPKSYRNQIFRGVLIGSVLGISCLLLVGMFYIINTPIWKCRMNGNIWTVSKNDPSYYYCLSPAELQCRDKNGLWDGKHCALPAADGKKPCRDKTDCLGTCDARALKPGETGTGLCSAYVFPQGWIGCTTEVIQGVVQKQYCHPDYGLMD